MKKKLLEEYKDNMIRIAEENWLPEHVRMLRALIVAADTDMDYQHAYEMANERAGEENERWNASVD